MKKMKNLTLILFLIVSSLAQCQTANIITETEFNNIKINNIDLLSIKNTFGNQTEIENLFGVSNSNIIDPDGDFYHYEFDGFKIGFSSLISGGTYENPIISKFEITNNNSSLTINGATITIGSSINLLGNTIKNTKINGEKNVIFMYCEGCTNYIAIDYYESNRLIKKITYIEQT